VGGELDALFPAFMGEQDDAVVAFLLQREARVGADMQVNACMSNPATNARAW